MPSKKKGAEMVGPFDPKRDRIGRSGMNTRGYSASVLEPGCYKPMDSGLERKVFVVTQFDPDTLGAFPQAIVVQLGDDGGKKGHYTPDEVVKRPAGNALVEAKYEDDLQNPDVVARLKRVDDKARREGYLGLFCITEKVIKREPRLSNSMIMKRYLKFPVEPAIERGVIRDVVCEPGIRISKLQQRHALPTRQPIWALLSRRVLVTDIDVPLEGEAPVWHSSNHPSQEKKYEDLFRS